MGVEVLVGWDIQGEVGLQYEFQGKFQGEGVCSQAMGKVSKGQLEEAD